MFIEQSISWNKVRLQALQHTVKCQLWFSPLKKVVGKDFSPYDTNRAKMLLNLKKYSVDKEVV